MEAIHSKKILGDMMKTAFSLTRGKRLASWAHLQPLEGWPPGAEICREAREVIGFFEKEFEVRKSSDTLITWR